MTDIGREMLAAHDYALQLAARNGMTIEEAARLADSLSEAAVARVRTLRAVDEVIDGARNAEAGGVHVGDFLRSLRRCLADVIRCTQELETIAEGVVAGHSLAGVLADMRHELQERAEALASVGAEE